MLKRKAVLTAALILLLSSVLLLVGCGEEKLKGEYVCEEPYLYLNIPDSDIIDCDGKMNLNGENCDILFSYNKDTRHFEIKRDNDLIFDGYYTTEDGGKRLSLKANEAQFDLERKD